MLWGNALWQCSNMLTMLVSSSNNSSSTINNKCRVVFQLSSVHRVQRQAIPTTHLNSNNHLPRLLVPALTHLPLRLPCNPINPNLNIIIRTL